MTPSKEDYIKAIYSLNGTTEIVSNKNLAQALGVSAASVTDMNTRLLDEQLIDYIPYQGVKLTELGGQIARKLIRKHRLWETFLCEKLHFDWADIHEEADKLEHVSSEELINKLDAFLDYPQTDPHGAPIPDQEGNITHKYNIPLAGAKSGEIFTIVEINDNKDILQYAFERHIIPGQRFKLVAVDELQGPLTLENIDGDQISVSPLVASHIFIEFDNE